MRGYLRNQRMEEGGNDQGQEREHWRGKRIAIRDRQKK